jgi:hypothetical protein
MFRRKYSLLCQCRRIYEARNHTELHGAESQKITSQCKSMFRQHKLGTKTSPSQKPRWTRRGDLFRKVGYWRRDVRWEMLQADYTHANSGKSAFMQRRDGALGSRVGRRSVVLVYELALSINYANAEIVMLHEYDVGASKTNFVFKLTLLLLHSLSTSLILSVSPSASKLASFCAQNLRAPFR